MGISQIVIHPKYKFEYVPYYDVALLKLEKPIEFTDHISPICLPDEKDPEPTVGTQSILSGWGATKAYGEANLSLKQVAIPLVSPEICLKANIFFKKDHMICFGLQEGNRGACDYDSGGPVVYQKPDGRWTQIGITSWFTTVCSQTPGSVHPWTMCSKVSAFIDFVKEHVKDI